MESPNLILNDQIVHQLRSNISHGGASLQLVPALLATVIRDGMWCDRVIEKTGARVTFDSFEAFVIAEPLEGLGTTLDVIGKLCRGDAKVEKLLEQAKKAKQKHGGDRRSGGFKDSNRKLETRVVGTTREYALRRLSKDRPDLHAKVLDKKLSPHAAMLKAGFRSRTVQVYPDDVERTARVLAKHFDAGELVRVLTEAGAGAGARSGPAPDPEGSGGQHQPGPLRSADRRAPSVARRKTA